MVFRSFLRSVRKSWWILAVSVVVCVGLAVVVTVSTTPVYQSTVKFYVVASASTGQSALQADELARQRIVGYASLIGSERIVEQIAKASGVSQSVDDVTDMISAFGDAKTLILTVNVESSSQEDSVAVASALAANFNRMVDDLEGSGKDDDGGVVLNVVGGPTIDSNPVSPREKLNLGLGFLLGLAAGIGILIARTRADNTLRSTEQVESETGLRLLATVPAENNGMSGTDWLASWSGPLRREAARNLRTNLHFMPRADSLRVIAVASEARGEGRTTVAVDLAISCSEAGYRTLLVEGDLQHPRLATQLKLGDGGDGGLTELLNGTAEVSSVVRSTPGANLFVVLAGNETARAPELLSNFAMETAMSQFRETYDVIIVDTAPLLPFADSRILCALADGVVMVTRFGRSDPGRVHAGLECLELVQSNLLGAVLNAVPLQRVWRRTTATADGAKESVYQPAPDTGGGRRLAESGKADVVQHDQRIES